MASKVKSVLLTCALLLSLGFNVATVTVQSVAMAVSGVVSAVAGASAILPEFRTVTYRGKKQRLADAFADTSRRISSRAVKSASRNAGSVVAEAIPVAGVAVILGVTAWDLKDSCETMKDLHELEAASNPEAELSEEVTEVCGMALPTKEEVWSAIKSSPQSVWDSARTKVPELALNGWSATKSSLGDTWDTSKKYLPEPKMPKLKLPDINLPEIDWTPWN